MEKVYIVGAKRTPIGKFGGALATLSASQLGACAIRGALDHASADPSDVDLVLMGNVIQAGAGQNPANQASVAAGLSERTPAVTVNAVCGSGLSAINFAASEILAGQANLVVAGGMESMSQAPFVLKDLRQGHRLGDTEMSDTLLSDALTDAQGKYHMGVTAENLVSRYGITREQMDSFALHSHRKAVTAIEQGIFQDEIIPATVHVGNKRQIVAQDEAPRPDTSLDQLSRLRPVFKNDGSVTAGNSSGMNDGAAALVLASESVVRDKRLTPLAQWRDSTIVGVNPEIMGIGLAMASEELLQKNSLTPDKIDLFELNEAFAAQLLACEQLLQVDDSKVNIHGGSIALGHPVGASGARIAVTLIHSLLRHDRQRGLAALCVGGGMGVATLFERTW